MKNIRAKYKSLVKTTFPELQNRIIIFISSKSNSYFMATSGAWFLHFIFIDQECFEMNDQAITGCLCHELAHIVWPDLDEREIDAQVINLGFGAELYEFIKYHDANYRKYNKSDGLTKSEIWERQKLKTRKTAGSNH